MTRESLSTIRATYDVRDGVRVYELHGDLLFVGAEQVLRTIDGDRDAFEVAILEVSRIDDINDAARRMLAGMRATLVAAGKEGFLVDPDNAVLAPGRRDDAVVFSSVDDALSFLDRERERTRQPNSPLKVLGAACSTGQLAARGARDGAGRHEADVGDGQPVNLKDSRADGFDRGRRIRAAGA